MINLIFTFCFIFCFTGLRPSIISGPFPFNSEPNGTKNGVSKPNIRHSFSYVNGHNTFLLNGINGHSEKDGKLENLEKEIEKLKTELEESRLEVKRLQEREQELTDRYCLLPQANPILLNRMVNLLMF